MRARTTVPQLMMFAFIFSCSNCDGEKEYFAAILAPAMGQKSEFSKLRSSLSASAPCSDPIAEIYSNYVACRDNVLSPFISLVTGSGEKTGAR